MAEHMVSCIEIMQFVGLVVGMCEKQRFCYFDTAQITSNLTLTREHSQEPHEREEYMSKCSTLLASGSWALTHHYHVRTCTWQMYSWFPLLLNMRECICRCVWACGRPPNSRKWVPEVHLDKIRNSETCVSDQLPFTLVSNVPTHTCMFKCKQNWLYVCKHGGMWYACACTQWNLEQVRL